MFQQPEILILTLEAGLDLGMKALWETGEGIEVQPNCQEPLKELGTGKNWRIVSVDGETYNELLLNNKINGDAPSYQLSFEKIVIFYLL